MLLFNLDWTLCFLVDWFLELWSSFPPNSVPVKLIRSSCIPISVPASRKVSFGGPQDGNYTLLLLPATLQVSSLLALFSCMPAYFPLLLLGAHTIVPKPSSSLCSLGFNCPSFSTFLMCAFQVSALVSLYCTFHVRVRCDKSGKGNPLLWHR